MNNFEKQEIFIKEILHPLREFWMSDICREWVKSHITVYLYHVNVGYCSICWQDSGHRLTASKTFTNIKLNLSHYNTSVSSSGSGYFIVIINVLVTPNLSKFLFKLSTDELLTTQVGKQFPKSTIISVKKYFHKSYLIIFFV